MSFTKILQMKKYLLGIAALALAFFGLSCPRRQIPKITHPPTKAFVEFLTYEFQKPEFVKGLKDMTIDHSLGAETGGIVALCDDEPKLIRSENLIIARKQRLEELAENLEESENLDYEKRHEAFEVLRVEFDMLFRGYFSSEASRCNPESVADGYWDAKHDYFRQELSRIACLDDSRLLTMLTRELSKELNNRLHFSKVTLNTGCINIGEIHSHNNKSAPSNIDHCIYSEVITERYGFVLSFQPGDNVIDVYGILNGTSLNSTPDGKEAPFASVNLNLYKN